MFISKSFYFFKSYKNFRVIQGISRSPFWLKEWQLCLKSSLLLWFFLLDIKIVYLFTLYSYKNFCWTIAVFIDFLTRKMQKNNSQVSWTVWTKTSFKNISNISARCKSLENSLGYINSMVSFNLLEKITIIIF